MLVAALNTSSVGAKSTGINLSRNGTLLYNRVEGLFASYRVEFSPPANQKVTLSVDAGYGVHNRGVRWEGAVLYRHRKGRLGLRLFDRTETNDRGIIRTGENTFNALIFKGDYRDYFRAKNGLSIYGDYRLRRNLRFTANVSAFSYSSMPIEVGWSLFRNSRSFRPNPTVREGDAGRLRAALVYDTRRRSPVFHNGLMASLAYERGFREFPYDGLIFAFNRRQKTVFGKQAFILRGLVGTQESVDEQYLFDMGGVSTLRGYRIKEFTGNRIVQVNIDYLFGGDIFGRLPIKGAHHIKFVLFGDAGWTALAPRGDHLFQGWGDFRFGDIMTNLGAGVAAYHHLVRINVARRFDSAFEDWTFSVRFKRDL